MTELTKDVLLAVLKSQKQIEETVLSELEKTKKRYDTNGINDLILLSWARLKEIRSQIKELEKDVI